MALERTLVIIKPDGVQRGLVGPILTRLESRGLKIVGLKLVQVSHEFAARHYAERAEPALKRFYDREVASLTQAVGFEVGFTLQIPAGADEKPVLMYGVIDRIDRHPDGTIEITDYKTGRSKNQEDVDKDDQLSAYALAMASGVVFAGSYVTCAAALS